MTTASIRPFDTCTLGAVDCVTLQNDAGVVVELLTLGATIRSIIIPDQTGKPTDIVLGFDRSQTYLDTAAYVGGCIGRYANRIGNATFSLNGQAQHVTANQNGAHHSPWWHFWL